MARKVWLRNAKQDLMNIGALGARDSTDRPAARAGFHLQLHAGRLTSGCVTNPRRCG